MKRLIAISLLFVAIALAGDKVAVSINVGGEVQLVKAETETVGPLKRGAALCDEDLIRTGRAGFATAMYLDDKTTIKIKQNTEFLIGGTRTQTGINKRVDLSYGTMNAVVTKMKGQEFIIATPTSVASVKGTELTIVSDPVKGDSVFVVEGVAEVTNNVSGQTQTVTGGQTASATPDGQVVVTQTEGTTLPDFGTDATDEEIDDLLNEIRFEIQSEDGSDVREVIIRYE